jgi:hypothetical protein
VRFVLVSPNARTRCFVPFLLAWVAGLVMVTCALVPVVERSLPITWPGYPVAGPLLGLGLLCRALT